MTAFSMSLGALSDQLAQQPSDLAEALDSPLAAPAYIDRAGPALPAGRRHSGLRGHGLVIVAGLAGAFEGCGEGEPFVRRTGDHTVVLRYEAGDIKARVAFDTEERVAGIVVIPPEIP